MQSTSSNRYIVIIAKIAFVTGCVFVGLAFVAFCSSAWWTTEFPSRQARDQQIQHIRIVGAVASVIIVALGVWLLSMMRKCANVKQPGDVTFIGCGLGMVILLLLGFVVTKT